LGRQVNVIEERRRSTALYSHDTGIGFGAPEALDLSQLGRVVLTVESAKRMEESFAPALPGGVPVALHHVELVSDESRQVRDDGFIGCGIRRRAFILCGFLGRVELRIGNDAQSSSVKKFYHRMILGRGSTIDL
jgi:hypothetical protein